MYKSVILLVILVSACGDIIPPDFTDKIDTGARVSRQEQPNWCWIADTQGLLGWGGVTMSQEEIASLSLKRDCSDHTACNKTGWPKEEVLALADIKLIGEFARNFTEEKLHESMEWGRPVLLVYNRRIGKGTHVVLVSGVTDNKYTVRDSARMWMHMHYTFSELFTDFANGAYENTPDGEWELDSAWFVYDLTWKSWGVEG